MRFSDLGWVICLAGLPWSYFLLRLCVPFQQLDIWHANSWWVQGWLLVLAGVHAWERKTLGKLPQSIWWSVMWSTGFMLWMFTSQLQAGQPYPMTMLAGTANLWSVLFALLLMTSWTVETLQLVSTSIFWSGVGLVVYGIFQVCNLDQFFHFIDNSRTTDQLVGTIGNPTHFACQLVLWLPFAWIRPQKQRLWVIPAIGLIIFTNSAVAVTIVGLFGLYLLWNRSKVWSGISFGIVVIVGLIFCKLYGLEWFNPHGRVEVLKAWWTMIVKRPILGWGVGFTKQFAQQLAQSDPLFLWKHLHNEYLQWWVETGAIGVGLWGWIGSAFWQRRRRGVATPLRWACGASMVVCLLSALLSFPFHLWQLGGWGLMAAAGWIVLTESQVS